MRIITGSARGCNLKTPRGMATRPTSDRVKESLFSILGSEVLGKKVLDIFAGTGGLGLEALSRGAESACFIDAATADIITFNARHTRLSDKAEIIRGDVFAGMGRLERNGQRFDLVFCDPPYHKGLWERAITWLDDSKLLQDKALIVVEQGGDENELPELSHMRLLRNQKYGRTTQINFFEYSSAEDIHAGQEE
ncbi:MAG: 16S rRNA (guanine(966)-N(2))-methyltransferase RsmD [Anaerovibrio sp.]|uniref:16S rRNA (guanine(966)-N(2))-methyltransferase RsmD n=1 Tax=Anaerovibrio sp. TaxID=1872532 RepID=UPI0025EE05DB|nr:16S rRNA (guanine(966)-N(2))-methyltransferase RsmD [Anaerovibrio sp.]MCR5176715.1 16S rRNA (guanine(966)-N(2))-methyltransferase RsmD [Anaerovibrio sp.]